MAKVQISSDKVGTVLSAVIAGISAEMSEISYQDMATVPANPAPKGNDPVLPDGLNAGAYRSG